MKLHEVNWTHWGANALAHQYGFVKAEVLRSNPHNLPLQKIWSACDSSLLAEARYSVERTKHSYMKCDNGLTQMVQSKNASHFDYRIVETSAARRQGAKVAVVVHLYYLDLLGEILEYLKNILEPFDLYLTTPFEADVCKILNALEPYGRPVTIMLCENRGRDVGPFLALCRTGMLAGYEAVLKLHSKKSSYSELGAYWRKLLYGSLCGSSIVVQRTLELLRRKEVGIVGPGRFFLSHTDFWGGNHDTVAKILKCADVPPPHNVPELSFFAGTMFWFTPMVLKAVNNLEGAALAFEPEEGQQDSTLAHAWERVFCILARSAGYRVTAIELNGEDIFQRDNSGNTVPVL
ncbi:MAG: hypothetical protein JZU50_06520 [Desulfobulbaceae bacterium]|nr:hypothetical protein [Desulfobulbaceae bacterium]